MTHPLSRRQFVATSAAVAGGLSVITTGTHAASYADAHQSTWRKMPDRVWLGPEYWANPMQDWRVAGGRIECVNAALDRNVHLLTRRLTDKPGDLGVRIVVSRPDGKKIGEGKGSFGFRVGIEGPLKEYRNSLWYGAGLNAGLTWDGALFIGDLAAAKPGTVKLDVDTVTLMLRAEPKGDGYEVRLTAGAGAGPTGEVLGEVTKQVPAAQLVGNVALVCNFGAAPGGGGGKGKKKAEKAAGKEARTNAGMGSFAFADWTVGGTKLDHDPARAFGPILFNHYTLSGGVMKMTAQMPPIGRGDGQVVLLEITVGDDWKKIGEAVIHPDARTATFRVENWNDKADVPYRLLYASQQYAGTIRRDPIDKEVITVADVSCNIHAAFPNPGYVANMAKADPDLMAFVGDQFYENCGGYGVQRQPVEPAIIDYLRKWYFHGWTWREMTKDRPALSLPDDHDVYQGNIWGEAGAARHGTQEMGGYDMDPRWVNVVHRTQASHHPDPFDPTPIKQSIVPYYGPMTYGRVSFAVIADRMFKSGPEGKVPPTGDRGDHVTDPKYDMKAADKPGLDMLGDRQLKFLREWAQDWKGADLKAVVSQTIFVGMATHHGGGHERLYADFDANGWPQTARNNALREIRKAFATHIAGDQHLPAVIQYGVDEPRDAGYAYAGPAMNCGYPRWFEPDQPGKNRAPGAPENTGDFLDGFGNHMRVVSLVNQALKPEHTPQQPLEMMQEKASGLALVRFNKKTKQITFDGWPFLADPTKDAQFPGWPVTFNQADNYAKSPKAFLPTLKLDIDNALVQVYDSAGDHVYSLRLSSREFTPPVFALGTYTVKIGNPDTGEMTSLMLEAFPS